MVPSFESERAALVRRNPWIMGLASVPLGMVVAALVSALGLWTPTPLALVPHLSVFAVVALVLAWKKNPWPREVPGKLEADASGVRWNGAPLVARAELKDGMVLPRDLGPPVVRLRRRGLRPAKDIRVSDREEGRALLRTLGLDASQAVAAFWLPSRVVSDRGWQKRVIAGLLGTMAVMGVIGVGLAQAHLPVEPLMLAWGLAISALGLTSAIPTKLRVGADGLHVSWWRSARFFGYGEIARIDPFEDAGSGKNKMAGLTLQLKSGELVRLAILAKRAPIRDNLHLIHERIAEAIETWSRGEGSAHAMLVRRGGREARAWVQALKGIGMFANADARTAPVLPEKLWRIVEDPAAPADARAGAAVALGASVDDEGRARLRAAAEATAAPKLRVAFESAATNAADEALAAALAEVEAEEARAEKRA